MNLFAFFRPSQCAIHSTFDFFPRSFGGGAFIETHDDIGAELMLDFSRFLGSQKMEAAIKVVPKFHAAVINRGFVAQRKDLIPPRIREDWLLPADELMQPSGFFHHVHSRPERKVVRIAEENLRTEREEICMGDSPHGAAGGNGHEEWGFDDAMRRLKISAPSKPRFSKEVKHGESVAIPLRIPNAICEKWGAECFAVQGRGSSCVFYSSFPMLPYDL